jgi:hypothetical protein
MSAYVQQQLEYGRLWKLLEFSEKLDKLLEVRLGLMTTVHHVHLFNVSQSSPLHNTLLCTLFSCSHPGGLTAPSHCYLPSPLNACPSPLLTPPHSSPPSLQVVSPHEVSFQAGCSPAEVRALIKETMKEVGGN